MKTLTMAAVNIDGVLLIDTFSPVLKSIVATFEIEYTPTLERALFSRPQALAAHYLISQYNLSLTPGELIKLFFDERDAYIKNNPGLLSDGVEALLNVLHGSTLSILCYGGLREDHFKKELGAYLPYFTTYICTNDFRPGIKEIVQDICRIDGNRIVFIDDVNTVAESAKENNIPFIGVPSTEFQKQDMIKTGVQFMVTSLRDIDLNYITAVDNAAYNGSCW
ncbi:MAG TPA: hypothetical protein PKN50_02875 [Spirochaetota bacterium]|nr:hypothetical protein [Spirochaetota bacterium]HPV40378.1 hypothetical protein [Spirochaetota bacterium]